MATAAEEDEAVRLTGLWRIAAREHQRVDSDASEAAEQNAWDTLIEHVEVSLLNYTKYDPR